MPQIHTLKLWISSDSSGTFDEPFSVKLLVSLRFLFVYLRKNKIKHYFLTPSWPACLFLASWFKSTHAGCDVRDGHLLFDWHIFQLSLNVPENTWQHHFAQDVLPVNERSVSFRHLRTLFEIGLWLESMTVQSIPRPPHGKWLPANHLDVWCCWTWQVCHGDLVGAFLTMKSIEKSCACHHHISPT